MPGYKRKRGKNSWLLTVTIGSNFSGKPRRFNKTVRCTSEREADKELALFYADCERGNFNRSSPITINDLCFAYLNDYAKRFLKKSSSYETNKGIIDTWIMPMIGAKKIAKLTRPDVQHWVNKISDKGRSPKTVCNCYSVLRSMYSFALEMDITEQTPCMNIKMPKKEATEANYFDVDGIRIMLRVLESLPENDLRFKCAILLGLFGGLRRGEILGLNWEDVNLSSCRLHIGRNRLLGNSGTVYEDAPKTERSKRCISVPGFLIEDLKSLRTHQKERAAILQDEYGDARPVLQGERGNPMNPQVLSQWFARFCEKNGLPAYGMHALRHTHASMLAKLGTDKMQVSSHFGHSQLSTTLNIYTHLFEDTDSNIVDNLGSLTFLVV